MTDRWRYRFDNFSKAYQLLREASCSDNGDLTLLEQEGLVQRFEYTWELAWKTLKDYLESQGIILEVITPAHIIRAALEANLIDSGDLWMEALDTRNKMSHTYDQGRFYDAVDKIKNRYLELFTRLFNRLQTI